MRTKVLVALTIAVLLGMAAGGVGPALAGGQNGAGVPAGAQLKAGDITQAQAQLRDGSCETCVPVADCVSGEPAQTQAQTQLKSQDQTQAQTQIQTELKVKTALQAKTALQTQTQLQTQDRDQDCDRTGDQTRNQVRDQDCGQASEPDCDQTGDQARDQVRDQDCDQVCEPAGDGPVDGSATTPEPCNPDCTATRTMNQYGPRGGGH